MPIKVNRIQITTHVHATEDRDKVQECLAAILPAEVDFKEIRAEGAFKNPILILDGEVKRDKKNFFKALIGRLSKEDRARIKGEMERRFSRGTFFLRLDKMGACRDEVALGDGIQVSAGFVSYPFDEEKIINELKEWF
jgi:hypothetical protein